MNETFKSTVSLHTHPLDPELVVQERELAVDVEAKIKEGFYELKSKFNTKAESSIYISH
jgi:hypothetical protein